MGDEAFMQAIQVKMARAALGLSDEELAKRAGISADLLSELEAGGAADPTVTQGLGLFFAANGIELIDSDGVRAKPRDAVDAVTVDKLTTENDGGEG